MTDIIRIPESEYSDIDGTKEYFTHFNLESTPHAVGAKYRLPRILKTGAKSHDGETKPILSLEDIYIAECLGTKNNIEYDDIDPKVFEFSMKSIKNAESLKRAILHRYIPSRPDMSEEEIISKGVGITFLKILGKA